MNKQVTDYILKAPSEQQRIMETIRQLIHESVPDVNEDFKWNRPVFKVNKDFAYLKLAKSYVTLGFFNFEKLNDSQNRLEGTGKEMRHVKVKSMDDIDKKLFNKWFRTVAE